MKSVFVSPRIFYETLTVLDCKNRMNKMWNVCKLIIAFYATKRETVVVFKQQKL
jgi:hypothetical protein